MLSTRNNNKLEQMMTEDVSASDVDEQCELEAETAGEVVVPCTSCSCQ